MASSRFFLAVATAIALFTASESVQDLDRRIAVVDTSKGFLAFATDFSQDTINLSTSSDSKTWSEFARMTVQGGGAPPVTSNPVAIVSIASKVVVVFAQCSDGQVYMFQQQGGNNFSVKKLSTSIPVNIDKSKFSVDGVKVITANNLTHLLVRSQTNASRIYYSYQNQTTAEWSSFEPIADDKSHLQYDFDVAFNGFVKRLEIFATFTDGLVKHTWQYNPTSFDNNWHKLGGAFSPKFNSAPAANTMAHSVYNGVLEVFVRDGDVLHHIDQETCDKVNNPWGPCTWSVNGFSKIGGSMPSSPSSGNPLTVSNNVHLGNEVFVIGADNGHLYHVWQAERGGKWSDWIDLGSFANSDQFASLPFVMVDPVGWWQAYGIMASGSVGQFTQAPLNFALSPDKVKYHSNVSVSWEIPQDQATSKDWIGIFPQNAENHKYVDFMYVGGTQNPRADPVPKGNIQFTLILPNGYYDIRYMVNKQYTDILNGSVSVFDAVSEPEWVQVYEGINIGLGNLNTNITKCVTDGNMTVAKFEESFKAFENREVFNGLNLFGKALGDVLQTLIQCQETTVVKDLEKFINDLIQCTEGNCAKFAIDMGLELVILYERIYEMYGDILAASNCFDIGAYKQGGICIGRVTNACLSLPD